MTISFRSYNHQRDYRLVSDFLIEIYEPGEKPANWLQPRWEYMHAHPLLDETQIHNFGLWEDNNQLVGVVHFELVRGEAFLQIRAGYSDLKEEMITYAENNLCHIREDGKGYILVYANDFDDELAEILKQRNYRKKPEPLPLSVFQVPESFPQIIVPEGFTVLSLADENDLVKVDRVLHRGFNHPGEPPADGVDGRRKMQSAENFRKDLNIIVRSESGEYVSFGGIWYEPTNKFAYVEPVATDPDYRKLGLGKAAVLESIRRCAELGATVAYVDSGQVFYLAFGFKEILSQYAWSNLLVRG
jgi:predicted N-acetyltransferase YhbS